MVRNDNEYLISQLKKNEEKGLIIEYINLTILNNFKSKNDSIELNNLLKDYFVPISYFSLCEDNVFNTHMYYNILQEKITELIIILDSIHNKNKTLKYLIQIKYTNKKNPIRIKINNKGKRIITLNANKIQSL